ncbi:MAG: hypothetical protein HQL45_04505 [Alphaproteobacteria bacterium]|nr:hypothetical protein [Alphaproteobacteria bacterium]
MTCESWIIEALAPFLECHSTTDGVRVGTQVLYPDGDCVSVTVSREADAYSVSDGALGWSTLLANGVDINKTTIKKAEVVARDMGLSLTKGCFTLSCVNQGQLGAAIVVVANASQRWVYETLRDHHLQAESSLRQRVNDILISIFPRKSVHHGEFVDGDSTKKYRVANVVHLDGRKVLFDSVVNHPIAIASTHLKFSDIGRGFPDFGREAVVQGLGGWNAEDVNILATVSTGISDIDKGLSEVLSRYPN